jgi:SsrA-binding protein
LVRGGELWLLNLHISAYSHSGYASHDPLRTRKLLLHKQEIGKLAGRVEQKGLALVALRLYFKNGRAKCELALVKGKKVYDRREEVRRRVVEREMEQELKRYR